LRFPARWFLFSHIALSALAALGFDAWRSDLNSELKFGAGTEADPRRHEPSRAGDPGRRRDRLARSRHRDRGPRLRGAHLGRDPSIRHRHLVPRAALLSLWPFGAALFSRKAASALLFAARRRPLSLSWPTIR